MINDLKKKYKNFPIEFRLVNDELIKLKLIHKNNSYIEVFTQGAHLTKWVDSKGANHIFTSENAIYKKENPIRGGNPIIFPQFGKGRITSHGFARRMEWQISDISSNDNLTAITLKLSDTDLNEQFKNEWTYKFNLELKISLGDYLLNELTVINNDKEAFSFTHGFHTYFKINDLNNTKVTGLSNLEYMDQLKENKIFKESNSEIIISEFTDRRYQEIPTILKIIDDKKEITVETKNCSDAFLWNPHTKGESNFKDLKQGEYKNFICLEPGNMQNEVTLNQGKDFTITQKIIID